MQRDLVSCSPLARHCRQLVTAVSEPGWWINTQRVSGVSKKSHCPPVAGLPRRQEGDGAKRSQPAAILARRRDRKYNIHWKSRVHPN